MSTPPAPRKRLPVNPSAEHLRKHAKRLAKRDAISLADAQHQLARDYGCCHWAELMHVVEEASRKSAGETELAAAVRHRDLAAVRALLEGGADPNARMPGGATPLHLAAEHGPLELIELLQTHRALAWITDDKGHTAADYARRSDSLPADQKQRVIELLTKPRIDDPVFRRAVEALDAGDVETLQRLLREQPRLAAVHAEEDHGSFAGAYFARPALLWFVANNPVRSETMPRNIVQIAEAIIDAGATREDITYTLGLVSSGRVAREQGLQIPLIDLLVRRGGDPSRALDAAVQEHAHDATAALLRLGAKPSLAAAAGSGDVRRVRELLAMRESGEAGGTWSPEIGDAVQAAWYNAAANGRTACIEALLDAGVIDVNARVAHGTTALHLAAYSGHREAAERLLAGGADATIHDARYDSTAAGWAEHAGHGDLARWLREREGASAKGTRPAGPPLNGGPEVEHD
jgi:ankyrin repeat protein